MNINYHIFRLHSRTYRHAMRQAEWNRQKNADKLNNLISSLKCSRINQPSINNTLETAHTKDTALLTSPRCNRIYFMSCIGGKIKYTWLPFHPRLCSELTFSKAAGCSGGRKQTVLIPCRDQPFSLTFIQTSCAYVSIVKLTVLIKGECNPWKYCGPSLCN